jgi:hypothetical protein
LKIFGSISELVSTIFRKDSQNLTLRPNQSTTFTGARDIQLPPGDANAIIVSEAGTQTLTNKTLTSPTITTPTGIVKGDVGLGNVDNTSDATKNSATATLTNKTIDGDDNTIQDLPVSALKTVLGDADEVILRDAAGVPVSAKIVNANVDASAAIAATKLADGSVDNTEFQRLGTAGTNASGELVTTDGTQLLQNKTIDGDENTVQDLPITAIKTELADANKVLRRDAAGIPQSGNTIPNTSALVTTDAAQVITAKDIDGGTASNTTRITLPSGTTAALAALTRKAGTVAYDTDLDTIVVDDGSAFGPPGGGGYNSPTAMSDIVASNFGYKYYDHGSSYAGGNTVTITPSTGTVAVGRLRPYLDKDGTRWLKITVKITGCSGGCTFTINGVNPTIDTALAVTTDNATPDWTSGFGFALTNGIFYGLTAAGTSIIYFSGDVQLSNTPNWVYV